MKTTNSRKRLSRCLMALGLALLAAAGGLVAYNVLWREQRAEAATRQVCQALKEQVMPSEPLAEYPDVSEMQSARLGDTSYIGILDIPALELSLPVERDFSYPALKENVCRYQGSYLEDDMIIAGHNYSCHFKDIHTLAAGDLVIFTDVIGGVFTYQVESIEVLDGVAGEQLPWDQPGLTLFTCTYSGQQRFVVRCAPASSAAAVQDINTSSSAG
ncbi:MAG TPA: sortase [Candidatus Fournierella merdigallinarum]|nr:sortase [Candidatus Fournierella merdigallinarum]